MAVYFIRAGGYFKIGYSDDPQRRFQRLHYSGTRYTFPPGVSIKAEDRELYKVVEGWKDVERAIQEALCNFDVGLEWFLDEPPLREFIDGLPTEPSDRFVRNLRRVPRDGGWCEEQYRAVQLGRGERETARYLARRTA